MELFQPLGAGSPWFASLEGSYFSLPLDKFDDQGLRKMRLNVNVAGAAFSLGRQLGNWGDLRWTLARSRQRFGLAIPEDPSIRGRTEFTEQSLKLQIDTLDSLAFPSRGQLLDAALIRQKIAGQADVDDFFVIKGLAAFRLGSWAGHVYSEVASTKIGGTVGDLGGFLRLSGSPQGSLSGSTVGMSRLVMARKIGEMPLGFGGAIRAGFSAEAGAIFKTNNQALLDLPESKLAGSGFISIDTRFGPFYLAAGSTYKGQSSLYLFLGPIW